jgi:DNA-binding response OmpR family regulator
MKYQRKCILVVDDEADIVKLIETILHKEGYSCVRTAHTGKAALHILSTQKIDLVLLDIMLPDSSGIDICREIRRKSIMPIIFLTAKDNEIDIVLAIETGGDDYITKPFSPKELVSRIGAQFRREELITNKLGEGTPPVYKFDHFIVDAEKCIVEHNGEEVLLTAKEYQLLLFFIENKNVLLTKGRLYEEVWGDSNKGTDNTLMVHISRLREKLELYPSKPQYIKTYIGLGYKFVMEESYEKQADPKIHRL